MLLSERLIDDVAMISGGNAFQAQTSNWKCTTAEHRPIRCRYNQEWRNTVCQNWVRQCE